MILLPEDSMAVKQNDNDSMKENKKGENLLFITSRCISINGFKALCKIFSNEIIFPNVVKLLNYLKTAFRVGIKLI